MENLSHTIEMLFCEMSMSEVLESWHKVKEPLMREISEDWFFRCFRERYPTYTNDQCRAVFGMLKSNWLKNSSLDQSTTTRSHIPQSVFNVLLHFSSSVLTEKNGNPVCRYEHLLKWNDVERLVGEDLLTTSFLAAKDLNLSFGKRNEFTWEHFVEHNNAILNSVLDKGTADIHAHLKGSTFGFDLSWLSLMNSIKNRNKQFNKFGYSLNPDRRLYHNARYD